MFLTIMYFSFLLWASTSAAIQPGCPVQMFYVLLLSFYCIIWTNKSLSLLLPAIRFLTNAQSS